MIRSIVILIAVCAISLPTFAKGGSHSVRGYTKKNGTHVAPSHDTEQSERFGIWFGGTGKKVATRRKFVTFLRLTAGLENL